MNRKETGGGSGIRTREELLTLTHFPGVRLQPLGHPSGLTARAEAHPFWKRRNLAESAPGCNGRYAPEAIFRLRCRKRASHAVTKPLCGLPRPNESLPPQGVNGTLLQSSAIGKSCVSSVKSWGGCLFWLQLR